jgi:acetolactate synthase I/II/III large subunit
VACHLDELKRDHPLRFEQPETGVLKPQTAIRAIHETWGDEAVYVAGVGQHQMWSAQHIPYTRGRQWINSGGLGTMGFAVPAAIGAKVGVGADVPVVAIDGDGCFQMTFQELAAAVQHASRWSSASSTTATSAWCASGSTCSTRTGSRRSRSRRTCRT